MDTLESILKPGEWKDIGYFYLPIEKAVDPDWIRSNPTQRKIFTGGRNMDSIRKV